MLKVLGKFILSAALGAPVLAIAAEVIRIAVIDPLSGPFALQGEISLRHIQMAVDRVNVAAGPAGNTIELTALDNKGSAQEALIALKQATDQNIRFVMQGVGVHVAHALIEAIAKHNERNPDRSVLYLNYSAPDPALTNEKCSFWHFRFDSHTDMKLDALTTALAASATARRVYLINQDYAYGQRISRVGKDMLGQKRPDIEISGDELHPLGKIKDFTPYVAKIKASGADTVLTGNWGNDLALLIRAGGEAGLQVTYYTLYAHLNGMGRAIGPVGTDRVKNVANWHANVSDTRLETFSLAYKRKYNEDWVFPPSKFAIDMFTQAVKVAGSSDPLSVARALEDMRFDAGTGELWMRRDDHQIIQALYVATLTRANSRDVKYDLENTGFGWKTNMRVEARDTALPTTCKMDRPLK
jgi:branched-chain amino acid transport system substrate-binding protein